MACCRVSSADQRNDLERRLGLPLPRLGTHKLQALARQLARRLHAGTARILSAIVRRGAGRWYVAFTCELTHAH